MGISPSEIPLDWDVELAFYWTFICQLLYNPVLGLIRASILFFLLRMGSQKPRVRMAIYVLNTFNFATVVAIFFAIMFQCRPVSYFWTQFAIYGASGSGIGASEAIRKRTGKCVDQPALYMAQAAFNILTDILTLAVPFWFFLGMTMPNRLRRATLCVFGLGIV